MIVQLLLYGVLVGIAAGCHGAGGGFLLIPPLVLILKMPMKLAMGNPLLIIALNSLFGFTGDTGHVIIDWKFLILVTIIAVAGLFVGGLLATRSEGDTLKKAFSRVVLAIVIFIFIKERFL